MPLKSLERVHESIWQKAQTGNKRIFTTLKMRYSALQINLCPARGALNFFPLPLLFPRLHLEVIDVISAVGGPSATCGPRTEF